MFDSQFSWLGLTLYPWYAFVRQWTGVVGLLKAWRETEGIFFRAKCFPVARKSVGNCS